MVSDVVFDQSLWVMLILLHHSSYNVPNFSIFPRSTTLRTGDEFIVLGCDGIWDCLSNEECVKYVYDRINVKSPHEIGTEMLDEIVSADPRASQGIGGDNMTVMIVDLLPHSRPYSN